MPNLITTPPIYTIWTYSSLFYYLDPSSESKLFTIYSIFEEDQKEEQLVLWFMPISFGWVHEILGGVFELFAEMTAHNVLCLFLPWPSSYLLGLYHAPKFEIDIKFRTPADNIVSLLTYKIVQGVGCELDWCCLSLGSSKDGVLYIDHVWKECLGMTTFFYENPLKRWKPLGRVWKSFLKFFNKDGE